jgi:valyl-tRNA synthetase
MNLEDYSANTKPESRLDTIDIIFLNKLSLLVEACTKAFDKYEYSRAKQELEKFFWNDFCDNYLEIVKKRVYNSEGDEKISAQYSLYKALLTIVKLFAPIMPFVTEEIYQTHFKKDQGDKSIHIASWPEAEAQIKDIPCHANFDSFVEVLSKVRQEKTTAQKSMNSEIILTLDKKEIKKLGETIKDLQDVTNAKEVKEGKFKVEFIESKE